MLPPAPESARGSTRPVGVLELRWQYRPAFLPKNAADSRQHLGEALFRFLSCFAERLIGEQLEANTRPLRGLSLS